MAEPRPIHISARMYWSVREGELHPPTLRSTTTLRCNHIPLGHTLLHNIRLWAHSVRRAELSLPRRQIACMGSESESEMVGANSHRLRFANTEFVVDFVWAFFGRKFVVVFLGVLVLGSFGYSISACSELRNWMVSSPVFGSFSRFNTPSGINGSISYDRGAVRCGIPFPDPQGKILAQGATGDIIQVSVNWKLYRCDLKSGVFQVILPPGKYHVGFTGYPLTAPANAQINLTNLPLNVTVRPHQLTQVRIGINFGI